MRQNVNVMKDFLKGDRGLFWIKGGNNQIKWVVSDYILDEKKEEKKHDYNNWENLNMNYLLYIINVKFLKHVNSIMLM